MNQCWDQGKKSAREKIREQETAEAAKGSRSKVSIKQFLQQSGSNKPSSRGSCHPPLQPKFSFFSPPSPPSAQVFIWLYILGQLLSNIFPLRDSSLLMADQEAIRICFLIGIKVDV